MDSFVVACQKFFSAEPYGRKVEVPEFKALTSKDKTELSQMLLDAGVEHAPYEPKGA